MKMFSELSSIFYITSVISEQLLGVFTEVLLSAVLIETKKFYFLHSLGTGLPRYGLSWEASVVCHTPLLFPLMFT